MRTIGNIIWLIFGGIWLALGYVLGGLLMCITIIGIPFGFQAFKLAGFALWPFGRSAALGSSGGVLEIIFNVLWLLIIGWGLFIGFIISGAIMCITIIGIPFGIQAFKMSVLALWPFGSTVVRSSDLRRA